MRKITQFPQAPDYTKVVINLRGIVLPVIDARIKFGLPETEYTNKTCIIVMDLDLDKDTVHIGAIVDEVLSVIEIEDNQIEPPPSIGNQYKSEFIYGMAKVEDNFVMLLDMQKVLSSEEMTEIADKTENQPVEENKT